MRCAAAAVLAALALAATESAAAPRVREGAIVDTLPSVEVTDRFERKATRFLSASQGAVSMTRLRSRPVYRVGEMLETVPGLAISQHSGEGKANQYYLRGFNLDHGTDFATTVAGVPVNLPTHGHGQGYSDLNFLVPELVSGVEYKKGPYFADEGDFGSAGAAHVRYLNALEHPIAQLSADRDGYRRGLLAGSRSAAGGDLLGALDVSTSDGPWTHPDDYDKVAGVARWGRADERSALRLTAMGYDGRWNATDQVPRRAIESGAIPRFGAIDPSGGGKSHRYSLTGEWQHQGGFGLTRAIAYGFDYRLRLWSNFTYFLDDSVNGDQFEQADERSVAGLRVSQELQRPLFGLDAEHRAGLDVRNDWIRGVGLYHTVARTRIGTVREDRVLQTSASPWLQTTVRWNDRVRTTAGVRLDAYRFRVASDLAANSGRASAAIVSPKLGVTLGPWGGTVVFLNAGNGFHSNDARGSTITRDPATGDPAERVDPLVRTHGAEVGVRTFAIRGLQSALSVWALDVDSELLFVGDAGATEASRPSRRRGIEWTNAWELGPRVTLELDAAWSRARFRDDAPEGDHIPGAIEAMASAGVHLRDLGRFDGALRYRMFGARPLLEDNSVRSDAAHTVNAELGCRLPANLRVAVEAFNLLDRRFSDIDYFYDSRLPGEPAIGVAGIHTHPGAPRTLRLSLSAALR